MKTVGKFGKDGKTAIVAVSGILFDTLAPGKRISISADSAEVRFMLGRNLSRINTKKFNRARLICGREAREFTVIKVNDCCAAICFYLGEEVKGNAV